MRPEREERKRKQHRNLVLGSRNSPFASHWFISMEPLLRNDSLVSLVESGVVELTEGCRMHKKLEDVKPVGFNGTLENSGKNEGGRKKKRRRKNKGKGQD